MANGAYNDALGYHFTSSANARPTSNLLVPAVVNLLSPEDTTARRRTSPTGPLRGTGGGGGAEEAHADRPTTATASRTGRIRVMIGSPSWPPAGGRPERRTAHEGRQGTEKSEAFTSP